jgi:hypothetical protein
MVRKFNSKRGAVGLSINTLVVVIISIVVLGLGVSMLYRFLGDAGDIQDTLDSRTENEIERLLTNQGKMVAVPFHIKQVERGDSVVYGVGILNPGGEDSSENYYVTVEPRDFVNSEGDLAEMNLDVSSWLLYNTDPIKVEEGDFVKELLSVGVPKDAATGEYIFNLKVCTTANCLSLDGESSTRHGNPQKFTVVVS